MSRAAAAAAVAVEQVVDRLFGACEAVAAQYAGLLAGRPAPTTGDLAPLRTVVLEQLRAHPEVSGCGAVVAPGVLADRPRWLEWWERGAQPSAPLRLLLDVDPGGEDVYDYPRMHWFAVPAAQGRRAVSGPYVDFRGANRYVYTFATPALADGRFVGVGGVDVAVERVEPLLLQGLDLVDGDALVVTADRRVVVATTGRWTPGARLRSLPEEGPDFAEVVPVTADLGWALAVAR